jgi:hypothetical protein
VAVFPARIAEEREVINPFALEGANIVRVARDTTEMPDRWTEASVNAMRLSAGNYHHAPVAVDAYKDL